MLLSPSFYGDLRDSFMEETLELATSLFMESLLYVPRQPEVCSEQEQSDI